MILFRSSNIRNQSAANIIGWSSHNGTITTINAPSLSNLRSMPLHQHFYIFTSLTWEDDLSMKISIFIDCVASCWNEKKKTKKKTTTSMSLPYILEFLSQLLFSFLIYYVFFPVISLIAHLLIHSIWFYWTQTNISHENRENIRTIQSTFSRSSSNSIWMNIITLKTLFNYIPCR